MIAVTGHHTAMCCPFCEGELLDGDPPVCFNRDCFLFGYPAPLPVQMMKRNSVPQPLPSHPALTRGIRRTVSTGPW